MQNFGREIIRDCAGCVFRRSILEPDCFRADIRRHAGEIFRCRSTRSAGKKDRCADARPGIMICESAPTTSATTAPSPEVSPRVSADGNSHVVARGETLTSIAKMHGVSVSDLQKYNHIDNPLKLQAGQTILIPPSPTPAPSASSSGE